MDSYLNFLLWRGVGANEYRLMFKVCFSVSKVWTPSRGEEEGKEAVDCPKWGNKKLSSKAQ